MRAVPLNRYIVFFSIAVAGCAVDLASKRWIVGRLGLRARETDWLWEGVAGLRTDINEGMLFGMGQGLTPLLATLSVAAAVGILVWLFYAGAARDWLLCTALACVMAGILGNLYDRLGLYGYRWADTNQLHQAGEPVRAVRDWIVLRLGPYEWPAFNVADSLLVCGAALLLWHAFTRRPTRAARAAKQAEPSAPG